MDLRRSDLGLLISLDALLAERSVTAAAKRLGISQPALSAQLARLRDLFGDDLLVGNAHGMTPTPRAEDLQEPLHGLLEELNTLISAEARFDPARDERTFSIAATDLVHAILLPPLLRRLGEIAPHVRLSVLPLVMGLYAGQMERGSIDFAVTTPATAPEGYPGRRLLDEEFCVIWRAGHPGVGETLTLEAFCAHGHVLMSPEGGGFRGVVDEALKAQGLERRVVASLPSFLLIPAAIRRTDYIAVVPRRIAALDLEGLRCGPVPVETPGFALYLSWHPRLKNDPGHRWMRDLIAAQCLD